MTITGQLSTKFKALSQLGLKQSANYILYQLLLRSGYFKLTTPALDVNTLLEDEELQLNWFLALPERIQLLRVYSHQNQGLIEEAEEILQKKVRFFGVELKTLQFSHGKELLHWSVYECGAIQPHYKDIKDVWEPARFNWAFTLGKAYYLTGAEKYAEAFWQYFEEFTSANPTNKGLNWTSAQEVSLRLIALTVCAHMLRLSPHATPQRMKALSICLADHACRIPPTIAYAKAQNNNHLLSEAVGLYTAAIFLPNHPQAARWREKGLRWFERAVCAQIDIDGTYIQHSTNYHRMVLMLALWMQLLLEKDNLLLSDQVLNKLAAATEWLAVRLDEISGRVPNLGHNDGSHILPFSNQAYNDYRPVVQAASRAFQAKAVLKPGPWDDLCLWLDIPIHASAKDAVLNKKSADHLILGDKQDWAAMRAVHFSARPAHADQLHVDIWHNGHNLAMDAGTFRYNAPPPWENSLVSTQVHNTITVNASDQMTHAGKFLWLDWAQAQMENISSTSITAIHFGYKKFGVLHRRTLQKGQGVNWLINDELLPTRQPPPQIKAALNWLLPDWPYEIISNQVRLRSPLGLVTIDFQSSVSESILDIYRGGESMLNGQKESRLGWYSPTYGLKLPALSIQFTVFQEVPIQIKSEFHLQKHSG